MMETQLSRSGNAPLDILWRGDEVESPEPLENQFLELVVAQCSRWRILRLYTRTPLYRSLLNWLRPAAGHFTQLEKLEVVSHKYNPTLSVPAMFTTAPALREVILTDRDFTHWTPTSPRRR